MSMVISLKGDLYYFAGNAENFKGITFSVKKNFNLVSLAIGGETTSAVNAGDLIGSLQEFTKPAVFTEFLVYDIKNHVTYSMTIDTLRAVRVYGNNLPVGAQLRGTVTYFGPNA